MGILDVVWKMIFKSIYLNLDRTDFPNDLGYGLLMKSRSLCHFLERKTKTLKFVCDGFNRLSIKGTKEPKDPNVNSTNVLCISVSFDVAEYRDLQDVESLNEFLISMLNKGMTIGNSFSPLPLGAIKEGIQEFRDAGFREAWTTPRRRDRKSGITAYLDCRLDSISFELFLVAEVKKVQIYRRSILKTDPDEVAFDYRFKDIVFEDGTLIVTSKTAKPLFAIEIKDMNTQQFASHNSGGSAPSA